MSRLFEKGFITARGMPPLCPALAMALAIVACVSAASAQTFGDQTSVPGAISPNPAPGDPESSGGTLLSGLPFRQELEKHGVVLSLQEDSEIWANTSGGGRRGFAYMGLTTGKLSIDLEKLLQWPGAKFMVSAYEIHGHGPTRALVGNSQVVSNIEAAPSIKLFDLWLDQTLLDGKVSIRAGQEGANDELMLTSYGQLYINASFGFPAMAADVLPSGGPNYPLATPFARLQVKPDDRFTLIGAVFNGDPAPPGTGDPQIRDRNGTAFRLNDRTLAFGELQYAPDPNAPNNLPTTYKIGAWYSSDQFADQRFDNTGEQLASLASTGIPRQHTGDWAVYGVLDQMVWQNPADQNRGIGVFALAMGGPSDRNLSNASAEAGVNWIGPFDSRPNDTFGFAVTYLGISPQLRRYSNHLIAFGQASRGYATNETVLEATYQAPINGWLTLQPDMQYVFNPNSGIPNNFGATPLSNAFVIALRVTLKL